jgi:hypothetical protein
VLLDAVPAGTSGNHGITAIPIYGAYCDDCRAAQAALWAAQAAGAAKEGQRQQERRAREAAAHRALLDEMPGHLARIRELAEALIGSRPRGVRPVIRTAWTDTTLNRGIGGAVRSALGGRFVAETRRVYVELEDLSPVWPIGLEDLGASDHDRVFTRSGLRSPRPPYSFGVTQGGDFIHVGSNCLPNYSEQAGVRFEDQEPRQLFQPSPHEIVEIRQQLERDVAADVSGPEQAPAPREGGNPLSHAQLAKLQSYRNEIARIDSIYHLSTAEPGAAATKDRRTARATTDHFQAKINQILGYQEM